MAVVFESHLLDLVLFVGVLLFYFHRRIQKQYRYFEDKGLPYIKPVYLLGSTFDGLVRKESLVTTYERLYRELKGKRIGGFFQFTSPVLMLRAPEMVRKFLVEDFSYYQDHGIRIDEVTNPLEGNLFHLSGGKWRALRKKLSPVFTSGKMKRMVEQVERCAVDLARSLDDRTEKDCNIKEAAEGFTTDVIGSCAFGVRSEAIRNPDSQFRKMGKKIMEQTLGRTLRMIFRFALPSVYFRLKIKTISEEVETFFSNLLSAAFQERKRTGEDRGDFVQLLMNLKEKGEVPLDPTEEDEEPDHLVPVTYKDKLEITDKLLTAQAFVFFTAGFETSATTIAFTLYLLAKNGGCQERAREEVGEMRRKYGGRLTYEALKELSFLGACISETLRMYPPADVLTRVCTKRHVLLDGLEIEVGVRVAVPVGAIHRDPEIHPDPEKFHPGRFLDGEGPKPGSYLPFGDGPRICIARRFALMEVKLAVAEVLTRFHLYPSPRTKEPLQLDTKGLALSSVVGGLFIRMKPIIGQ